jgi:fimbrial chaperone protein
MLHWILAFLVLNLAAADAAAASFLVNPTRVSLSSEQRVIALKVTNNGTQPVRVQAQPTRWLLKDNEDQYLSTDELLVNPPLFGLEVGATQIVRVGLRNARAKDREATYRLFLTEVPGPVGPDFKGLTMTLRLGIPIFVLPAQRLSPELEGQITAIGEGLQLTVSNSGSAHARLIEAVFSDANAQELGRMPLARDVLPGQHRSIPIVPAPALRAATHAHILTEPKSADLELELPAPPN